MARNGKLMSVRMSDEDLECLEDLSNKIRAFAHGCGVRRTKNLASVSNVLRALMHLAKDRSIDAIYEEAVEQARRDGPKSYRD